MNPQKTIVGGILASLGIVVGGVTIVKAVKYVFTSSGFIIVIGIVVVTKMVSNTIINVIEIRGKQTFEVKMVEVELEIKNKVADREQVARQQEYSLKMEQITENKRKEELQTRKEAFSKLESQINQYNEDTFGEYNKLKREYDVLVALAERLDDPATNLKKIYLGWDLEKLRQTLPTSTMVRGIKEKMNHDVMVAYGLIQDSTIAMKESTYEVPTLDIVKPEKVVPDVTLINYGANLGQRPLQRNMWGGGRYY